MLSHKDVVPLFQRLFSYRSGHEQVVSAVGIHNKLFFPSGIGAESFGVDVSVRAGSIG